MRLLINVRCEHLGVGSLAQNGGMGLVGKMLGHGISQGVLTAAQGGKFQHGFFAAAFSAGFAPSMSGKANFGKVVASSIVGGTASVLGGGKFANGAITGAYVMLFNHMRHTEKDQGMLYKNKNKGYAAMWEKSFENGEPVREVSGWELEKCDLLPDGGLIMLPLGNERHESDNSAYPVFRNGGKLFVRFGGVDFEIVTHVHTHPDMVTNPNYHPIGYGKSDANMLNFVGKPINILYNRHIYSVDGTYNKTKNQWNYKDLGTW